MGQLNTKTRRGAVRTHEGGLGSHIDVEQQLRRSVMSCMLWEKTFYEDGIDIADRIAQLIPHVDPEVVSKMAIVAREDMNLRHVPLVMVRELARTGKLNGRVLSRIIQRADELTEFLAIYWKDGRCPLSAQVKKGLASAFNKFGAYQLAKYNRDKDVKLRDVLFLCHAKPKDDERAAVWKKLVDGTLESPDTWEVKLSADKGKNKKETWEKLLAENKLGGLALLRNLRNMHEEKVNPMLVVTELANMNTSRILPFRFIAAAKHAPQWETNIEEALIKCLEEAPKFRGKTVVLVDVSGSMGWGKVSTKSEMTYEDIGNGIAICARELCDDVAVYSFSNATVRVPDRHGFALSDAIKNSQPTGGTYLAGAIRHVNKCEKYDRIIVVTDEQSHDGIAEPTAQGYLINVAANKNGVGYGKDWVHIDGFSEAVLKYIMALESPSVDRSL